MLNLVEQWQTALVYMASFVPVAFPDHAKNKKAKQNKLMFFLALCHFTYSVTNTDLGYVQLMDTAILL